MSTFTVLGDTAIKQILLDLSRDEIGSFQRELEDCLIGYSRGRERQYQPSPGIINRPDGQKILFRPFTSPETVGTKIIVHPAPISEASDAHPQQTDGVTSSRQNQQLALHGILALCDKCGIPTGVLNAEEVTGFRTSLSAMIPYGLRRRTDNIIVFGAGKQALWHSRLALALRGSEIKSITIVNRSEDRAQELIRTVKVDNQLRWRSSCQFNFLNSSQPGAQEQLQSLLAEADVIFCTVPSQRPLFSLQSLALEQRQARYPFISAVGSWQSDMIEVDPEIIQHVTSMTRFHAADGPTGAVLVDDAESALIHSGEIVQSGLTKMQMLEIGQILSWKRDPDFAKDMATWLAEGLIVYKSIGVSVTDLAAGNAILALARKKKLGTTISDF